MLVTLPLILLLLDYWPLQRYQKGRSDQGIVINPLLSDKRKGKSRKKNAITITDEVKTEDSPGFNYPWAQVRKLFWEKIPLFAIAALSSIVTYIVQQRGGAVKSIQAYSLPVRLQNAFVSYVAYFGKMIWPDNLAVFYPHPGLWQRWQVSGAVLILVAITFLVIREAKRFPYLIVGWLWYVGTLVPVIGIVQVGEQTRADRYTYIPLIGLFIMAAWIVPELLKKWRYREKVLIASSVLILACFSMVTWKQVGYWHNSFTLFDHALDVTKNNSVAYTNLGYSFNRLGNQKQAILDYDRAIKINTNNVEAYTNRGFSYAALGNQNQAIEDYNAAIEIKPDIAEIYFNRGNAYAALGDQKQAIIDYDKAIEINPEYAAAFFNRGIVYTALGNQKQAIVNYDRAIEINPEYAAAYFNRGNVNTTLGNLKHAILDYDRAIKINPNNVEAYTNRGNAYAALGNQKHAIVDYDRAIKSNPKFALAYFNRGKAYAALGNQKQAVMDYKRAIDIDPRFKPLAYP